MERFPWWTGRGTALPGRKGIEGRSQECSRAKIDAKLGIYLYEGHFNE
jgi:hypothetical protein